ncbi:MAG: restriction endonuclease [Burkholderiales bacterium]
MKLPQNSLFAILLRSRWWVSALIALGVFVVVRLVLDAGFGFFAALPFAVIALVVLWRELRAPRGARLERALAALRELSWEEFAAKLEAGYRRQGYAVTRAGGAADFELDKDGAVSLVAAKRWKASRSGVEPLKELAEAGARREARACIFACAAGITDQARRLAAEKGVKILEGAELVSLVRP